jgi:hypothetical protein
MNMEEWEQPGTDMALYADIDMVDIGDSYLGANFSAGLDSAEPATSQNNDTPEQALIGSPVVNTSSLANGEQQTTIDIPATPTAYFNSFNWDAFKAEHGQVASNRGQEPQPNADSSSAFPTLSDEEYKNATEFDPDMAALLGYDLKPQSPQQIIDQQQSTEPASSPAPIHSSPENIYTASPRRPAATISQAHVPVTAIPSHHSSPHSPAHPQLPQSGPSSQPAGTQAYQNPILNGFPFLEEALRLIDRFLYPFPKHLQAALEQALTPKVDQEPELDDLAKAIEQALLEEQRKRDAEEGQRAAAQAPVLQQPTDMQRPPVKVNINLQNSWNPGQNSVTLAPSTPPQGRYNPQFPPVPLGENNLRQCLPEEKKRLAQSKYGTSRPTVSNGHALTGPSTPQEYVHNDSRYHQQPPRGRTAAPNIYNQSHTAVHSGHGTPIDYTSGQLHHPQPNRLGNSSLLPPSHGSSYTSAASTPGNSRTTSGKSSPKNRRSDNIKNYKPEEHYLPLTQVPQPWGPIINNQARFHYNPCGELDGSLKFHLNRAQNVDELTYYLQAHPVNTKNGEYTPKATGPTLWIQYTPADSKRRYHGADADKCRIEHCPVQNNTMRKGEFRITFDEQDPFSNTDPMHNAGYVHLYCFEKHFDLPEYSKVFNFRADSRKLDREPQGKNGMALNKEHQSLAEIAEDYIRDEIPWHQRPSGRPENWFDFSLTRRLVWQHIKKTSKNQKKTRKERGGVDISKHLGNLDVQVTMEAQRKAEKAEEARKAKEEGRGPIKKLSKKRKSDDEPVLDEDWLNGVSSPQPVRKRQKK